VPASGTRDIHVNARLVVWVFASLATTSSCIGSQDITLPEERQLLGGSIQVSVSTTGSNVDPDGYQVSLDEELSQPVAVNGSATFSSLRTGTFQVILDGVAENCTVSSQNPQGVSVSAGSTVYVAFMVVCA
jgi:hypothetical protein